MHTQLRYAGIHGPHTELAARHGPDRAPTADIVPDLKDLQHAAASVRDPLQQRGADGVGGHVAVGVGGDGDTDVEARRVVLEVRAEKVGVHGVDDVGGDEEGVRQRLVDEVRAELWAGLGPAAAAFRRLNPLVMQHPLTNAIDDAAHEVALGALAEEAADLFVIEAANHFHDAGGRVCGGG